MNMIHLALALVLVAVLGWVTACLMLGAHLLARYSLILVALAAFAVWVFLSPQVLCWFGVGALTGLIVKKGK